MVSCNIDDMSGEIYSYLMDILLEAGALDVTYQQLQMKKNRPGAMINVLCQEASVALIEKILLTETTTFGVRKHEVERTILRREFKEHETEFGVLTLKYGYYNGELIKITPEYESLKAIAKEHRLPLIEVYKKVESFIAKL